MKSYILIFLCLYFHESFAGEGAKWGYFGETGPKAWGKHFSACNGKRQSPVDINTRRMLKGHDDVSYYNYDVVPMTYVIQNNGHTVVMSETKDQPEVAIELGNGKRYRFLQLHFHWGSSDKVGSEHTVDRRHYPLEMHLVHANLEYDDPLEKGDGLAVLGVLFKIGKANRHMNSIINSLQSLKYLNNETLVEPFSLDSILPQDRSIYRYMGSLTTPPCSEAVVWSVYEQTMTISKEQMEHFRTMIDNFGNKMMNNYRPVMPMNGRRINDMSAE